MRLIALLFPALFALPAQSETISQEIAHTGLAATEARLTALPAPTDADRFALGGVQFLRAIEGSFQDRYTYGLTDPTRMVPLLRLPIPDNPTPTAFDPAVIANIFIHAEAKLTAAKATLAAIPATSDFGLEIAIDDLWFDVNQNATREPREGIADILGVAILGGVNDTGTTPQALPTVRFDVADAAWLAAYADMLTGVCQMVRAYDPTEPVTRIMNARAAMQKISPNINDLFFGGDQNGVDGIDVIAGLLATLNQTPDGDQMAAARQSFLAMVAENREFWARVAQETDNKDEWLPNDSQTSALGVELPKGTGAHWMALLTDAEAILNGEKLVPYPRIALPGGINIGKMFTDPRPIDVAGWIQGWAALPYLESGPLVSTQSADAFDQLTNGRAMLFALYLN